MSEIALETLEEIYQAARQLPESEQAQLLEKLNGDLTTAANGDQAPGATETTDTATATETVEPQPVRKMPEWAAFLIEAGRQLEAQGVHLPSDFAEEHDHYIYGTPKRKGRA